MEPSHTLRRAFVANALFSLLSALAFIRAAESIAAFSGLPSPLPVVLVGLGLAPCGAALLWLSRRPALSEKAGHAVIAMDAQWVLGTVVLLLGWPDLLSPGGRLLAVSISVVVGCLAFWQLIGTRRMALESSGARL